MINRILIANRGEIACRVIKTAKRLGIETVAVYSDPDRDALHVQLADQAVRIGPAPAAESYLLADRIIEACQQTGAQAVHPGYGFLSERAEFAQRLADVGVAFIGPPPDAIRKMGDKLESKRIAMRAGVNTVPGFDGVIDNADHAVRVARDIGYPVMLKASAGGGGKGMRVARNDDDCRSGFEAASNEARSSFGDDRVLIEKFIEQPRHIEIQVLADSHGNVLHLGERECSLQRRHQKVIEESPSPLLDQETRDAMGAQAVALATAVGYESAGTVEFIVGPDRDFYFLEMNTRLQVEHPVTEYVTGIDLVEQMIRVAAGEALTFQQADVRMSGWAIEARVYAEDPFRNFLPSIGRLVRYLPPPESHTVRVDTGVYEGAEVSMHYDPMIAKLITHASSRDKAIAEMRSALNEFYIRGVSHNLSFLGALIKNPHFVEGKLHTGLIADTYPDGFRPDDVIHDEPEMLVSVAASIHRRYMDRAAAISGQMEGYERIVQDEWVVLLEGKQWPVTVRPVSDREHRVECQSHGHTVLSDWQFGQPLFRGTIDGVNICIQVERRNMVYRLFHWGAERDVMVLSARAAELLACMPVKPPPDMSKHLLSPMPGLLTKLSVQAGEAVKVGQDLAVIEAMKMENRLQAEHEGVVAKVLAEVGDSLAVDQAIIEFE